MVAATTKFRLLLVMATAKSILQIFDEFPAPFPAAETWPIAGWLYCRGSR
jgi:hypothetical protein